MKSKKKEQLIHLPKPDDIQTIVGLDLSLTRTGYCIIRDGKTQYDILDTKGLNGFARISWIKTEILLLLKELPLAFIAIEGYSFGSKGQAGISLGELGGSIRLALYEQGYQFIDIPPTVNKKFLCNKGNVDKSLMLKELYKVYNYDIDDDNVCDAIVLSELASCLIGKTEVKRAYQKNVIEELKKKYE